jgi:hypothetical protein
MTADELNAIDARASAATPGPWTLEPLEGKYYGTEILSPVRKVEGGQGTFCIWNFGDRKLHPSPRQIEKDGGVEEICDDHYEDEQTFRDADFVVSARSDVPALVAEVRRLWAACDAKGGA